MLKKIFSLFVISITLFYSCQVIYAYEYIDPNNESGVIDKIIEIFDSKQQYEDLAGSYEEQIQINNATSTSYWWPMGSNDVIESNGKKYATGDPEATIITSPFSTRTDPFGSGNQVFHSGMDIIGGDGDVNIIAAKSGIVVYVYPSNSSTPACTNSSIGTNSDYGCGGGYGNHVVIQHSDGNYTLYGHMEANTLTVKAGESVEQGQVIGKMGSSGYSTGPHLHFEVRVGQNSKNSAVDPSEYISLENARSVFSGNSLLKFVEQWEGHSPIEGDYYYVEDIGDGVRTVGSGVTLEYNGGLFKKYGIDTNDYQIGSKIPISIVDQIKLEILSDHRSRIENLLANNSINLKEYQIDALVSMSYNLGNVNSFPNAYREYGDTESLRDNWFLLYVSKGSIFEVGLTRRRTAEWKLFHTGDYGING